MRLIFLFLFTRITSKIGSDCSCMLGSSATMAFFVTDEYEDVWRDRQIARTVLAHSKNRPEIAVA
jgi:hypothetical protein